MRMGGAASPMRRGLKPVPFGLAPVASMSVWRRRLPDAKGIETLCSIAADSKLPVAAPPPRCEGD